MSYQAMTYVIFGPLYVLMFAGSVVSSVLAVGAFIGVIEDLKQNGRIEGIDLCVLSFLVAACMAFLVAMGRVGGVLWP